jgi:hypothetical protein
LGAALAAATAFAGGPEIVQAAKPVVVVDADTSELPDFFRPDDVDVLGNLEQTLEREAAGLLQVPFPLFQWVAAFEATGAASERNTLMLKVLKVPGVSRRVFIKTSYKLGHRPEQQLSIAETELYAADDQYLTGIDLDLQAQERGRTALAMLTDVGNLDLWRERFIRKVPLAADLEHASGMRKFLILPVLARELQADRSSEFEAVVPTLLPGQTSEEAVFVLSPTGPENGDFNQGKLECMVKRFTFGGLAKDGYVDDCAKVITHRVLGKASVHATVYFKSEPGSVSLRP